MSEHINLLENHPHHWSVGNGNNSHIQQRSRSSLRRQQSVQQQGRRAELKYRKK